MHELLRTSARADAVLRTSREQRRLSGLDRLPTPHPAIMTTLAAPPAAAPGHPEEPAHPGGLLNWLTSTDHKVIGKSYLVTAFGFFCLAGLLAEVLRTQLAGPNY